MNRDAQALLDDLGLTHQHITFLGDVQVRDEDEIGRGSDAVVYKVNWQGIDIALKVLHPVLVEPGVQDRERKLRAFGQELFRLSRVHHPNLCQLIGLARVRGNAALALELLSASLEDVSIGDGREDAPKLVSYLCDASAGLRYLHSFEIIHRDLAPKNVLVKNGTAKVSDFGGAKFVRLTSPRQQQHQVQSAMEMTRCPGTLPFMAPEALSEAPDYNRPLDVFSLGVMMLSVLTGVMPGIELMTAPHFIVVRERGQQIEEVIPETTRRARYLARLPDEHPLKPLIRRCLSNRPGDRPSAEQAHEEIKRFLAMFSSILPSQPSTAGTAVTRQLESISQQLSQQAADITARSSAVEDQLSTITQRLVDTQLETTAIRGQLQTTNQQVTGIHDQLQTTNQQVTGICDQLQTTNQQVTVVRDQLQTTNQHVTGMHDRLEATNQQVTAIRDQLQTTNQQVTKIHDRLQTASEQVTEVHDDVETMKQQVTTIRDRQETTHQQVTTIRDRQETTHQQVTTIRDRQETTHQQVTTICDRQETTHQQVTMIRDRQETAGEKVTGIRDQLQTTNQQVSKIRNRVEATSEQATGIHSRVETVNEQVASLQGHVAAIASQQTDLQASISEQLDGTNRRVAAVSTQVTATSARVSSIDEQLSASKGSGIDSGRSAMASASRRPTSGGETGATRPTPAPSPQGRGSDSGRPAMASADERQTSTGETGATRTTPASSGSGTDSGLSAMACASRRQTSRGETGATTTTPAPSAEGSGSDSGRPAMANASERQTSRGESGATRTTPASSALGSGSDSRRSAMASASRRPTSRGETGATRTTPAPSAQRSGTDSGRSAMVSASRGQTSSAATGATRATPVSSVGDSSRQHSAVPAAHSLTITPENIQRITMHRKWIKAESSRGRSPKHIIHNNTFVAVWLNEVSRISSIQQTTDVRHWTDLPLPRHGGPFQYPSLASNGQALYMYCHDNQDQPVLLQYDQHDRQWVEVAKVPAYGQYRGCVVHATDTSVSLLGGMKRSFLFLRAVNHVSCYTLLDEQWKSSAVPSHSLPALPCDCAYASLVACHGSLYIIGGDTGCFLQYTDDGHWQEAVKPDGVDLQFSQACSLSDDSLVIASYDSASQCTVYNVRTHCVYELPSALCGRCRASSLALLNGVVVLSTGDGQLYTLNMNI
ncbi:bone morphogenetic protein receptor type-2-like isoform X4 [Sycon ciliatum]|uniref:bone morphogenetic protein receptor type-2-like isoform X4 n=1 Tax=Sycon ciliatum TaxID=27933 RepID=UPI0031F71082